MIKKISKIPVLFLLTACYGPKVTTIALREIASVDDNAPVIKYITYDPKTAEPRLDIIDEARWEGSQGGFSEGGRLEYLKKFFYANTREKSNTGLKHAVCFEGQAKDIQSHFFDKTNTQHKVKNVIGSVPVTKTSFDGLMIGVRFEERKGKDGKTDYFFRIPNCLAGKSPIDEGTKVDVGLIDRTKLEEFEISDYARKEITGRLPGRHTAASAEEGFVINDTVSNKTGMKVPQFSLRADYDKYKGGETFPWKGADASTHDGALKLAFVLQQYIYENMANQNPANIEDNFVATKNTKRYFCQTPWLNQGPAGREGVHGLTKERDLKSSEFMDVYEKATPGSNWGISFYNGPGCKTIGNIYGSSGSAKPSPDFSKANFEQATYTAKILFTTADFPEIKGAYTWTANVSEPGSNFRSLKPVRQIQMDVAVKDKSIKGTNPALGNWLMYTYYYDPNFDYEKEYKNIIGENPLLKIPNIPKGLLKMRPMGIQTGFGAPGKSKDTVIFVGAQTNGLEGRLNGPADNPKGSCLSCHGTAGVPGMGMVPGFLSNSQYKPGPGHLDFSQQFALGKRNYETIISPKKIVKSLTK
ncbi:MAG: hypothetical protein ACOYL6_12710 [Bacteriovoracaceae bacterium]